MAGMTEFYRWWITNEVTGERVLTPYKLTRAHAALAFPGAEPDVQSREMRALPDLDAKPWAGNRHGELWDDGVPGDTMPSPRWSDSEPGK
jgi:hypothetical protein